MAYFFSFSWPEWPTLEYQLHLVPRAFEGSRALHLNPHPIPQVLLLFSEGGKLS